MHKVDTSLYSGMLTEYYSEANQKKFENKYHDGIKNGKYISWFKNGEIKVAGKFDENKRIGVWNWYTEEGRLQYSFDYSKA